MWCSRVCACGAAACVAGGFVGYQRYAAEADRVSVMENAIDMYGSVSPDVRRRRQEVCARAGFNDAYVAVHHHVLRRRLADHLRCSTHMIGMRLVIEQNSDVTPMKSQRFHTCFQLWWRSRQVRIDEDIALRRNDEVAGKVLTSHVIEVVSNAKGSSGGRPGRVHFSKHESGPTE
jgi:hypothetical protein